MVRVWTRLAALGLAFGLAGAARAGCTLDKLAEFPVRMSAHRPLVDVTLNGVGSRMIVDSGAFFSSLTPDAASGLHLMLRPAPEFQVLGVGGVAQMQAATLREFAVGRTALGASDILVGGPGFGDGVAGLLGHNVLRIADAEYDLSAGAVRLMRPQGCDAKSNLAYWAKPGTASVLDVRRPSKEAPHTVGTAMVNGVSIRVVFDTGASFSALTRGAAARAGVRLDGPGVTPAGEIGGIGPHRSSSWIATFDSFRLGSEEIRHAHLRIADVGVADYDMLLGADFFLSHRVYVSDSRQRMWFTYQGGPVFDLRSASAPDAQSVAVEPDPDAPKDADGLSRRAAALIDRRAFGPAIADLTEAMRIAPGEPRYLRERALANTNAGRYAEALVDEDAVLKLRRGEAEALADRVALHLLTHDDAEAEAELGPAEAAAGNEGDLRLLLANYALALGGFDDAVRQSELWSAAHPGDAKEARAMDLRCEALGFAGRDLDSALAECDGALRRSPGDASALEDRALVRLRRGEPARAEADIAAALRARPGSPQATGLRGLLKLKRGDKAGGEADLAAAAAVSASPWAREAKAAGLAP